MSRHRLRTTPICRAEAKPDIIRRMPNWRSVAFEYEKLTLFRAACDIAYAPLDAIPGRVENELGISARDVETIVSVPNAALENLPHQRRRCISIVDTQAFIAGDRDKIIVAFRGTESTRDGKVFAKDWGTDALFHQARFNNYYTNSEDIGAIHAGFGKAAHDIWDRDRKPSLHRRVAAMRKKFPDASLWITGHSLGGALAIVTAAGFCFDGINQSPVAGVYTFGQPRVGDSAFRNAFEGAIGSRTYFVVNDGDLVTRVPPRSFPCIPGLNYAVTGRILFLEKTGPSNDPTAWHRFLQSEQVGWERAITLPNSIKDHALPNYAAKIGQYRGEIEALTW